jgi:hypothetical protein
MKARQGRARQEEQSKVRQVKKSRAKARQQEQSKVRQGKARQGRRKACKANI